MEILFNDKKLIPVWNKIQVGKRLNLADGIALFDSDDIISIGKMASFVQQRINGDAVYFALNQKVEPSNICELSCKFCNFSKKRGEYGAYDLSINEILGKITPDIREVHITGSLNPARTWDYYLGLVSQIKSRFPHSDIKAFTAIEIDFFHKKFKTSTKDILRQLKEAGLSTLPGGGAEVFSERVHRRLFPRKIGAEAWLNVHATAHKLGIPTNATMLYGHIETYDERLRHMIRLRDAQDKTGGFLAFIPLAFQPGDTGIKAKNEFTSAIDDLKTIAVSRLMLDNFPHIKAYWVMLTEDVASAALSFGADDIDGTVGGESIAHAAGATSPMKLAKDRLIKIIAEAGKIPVERDGHYRPLDIYSDNVIGKIPYLNSFPFYNYFKKGRYKMLPIVPRRMGLLSLKGRISAGIFSLVDFISQEDKLELLDYCIAVRGDVKSVMLFSRTEWSNLDGKNIGITDDTSTSVQLLRLLLKKKYSIGANLVRMKGQALDDGNYAAVLLIGDEALRCKKYGLAGFKYVFDLATEWFEWQQLPFVFALWAQKKSHSADVKKDLSQRVGNALADDKRRPSILSELHGKRIGLTPRETKKYLDGFTFKLGKQEKKAMEIFKKMLSAL